MQSHNCIPCKEKTLFLRLTLQILQAMMLSGLCGARFCQSGLGPEIPPFGPANEIGIGNSISQVSLSGLGLGMDFNQSHYRDWNGTILSPGTQ